MSRIENDDQRPPRRTGWPRRVVLFLVPLHLLAFLALYFGAMRIVRGEILRTHSHDAKILLNEAVQDIHPLMVAHDVEQSQERLQQFIKAHELLDLRLFGPDGTETGADGDEPIDREVQQFFTMDEPEWFQFEKRPEGLILHGMIRLDSEGDCQDCHTPDALIGVASMHLDMTPQVADAHGRMGRHIAGLIVVWVLAVAILNVLARMYVRRSVARLEAGIQKDGAMPPDDSSGMAKLLLDPVSARLYRSLEDVLEKQQRREEQVSSRLQHTERLASLGQLAAGLAHEIKNPLAGIHGVLELLRDETSDASKANLYQEMVAELDRVNATIHSLLSFARPAPVNKVPTDIGQLVDGTVKLMQPGLTKRSIRLDASVAPDLSTVDVDPDQIRQVLVNLIGNAADAIDRKGEVTVRAARFPDGHGLIIAVEDDGPGIPPEELAEIFEPFFTTKFSGTGLGLSVARSLVDKHGGKIEVESEVGRGTTFFVVLPGAGEPADGGEQSEA